MAVRCAAQAPVRCSIPRAFRSFRFTGRELDARRARARSRYALDDEVCVRARSSSCRSSASWARPSASACEGLLSLLHWVAGVSYFKTALPAERRLRDAARRRRRPRRCSRRSTRRASASSPTPTASRALPRPRFPPRPPPDRTPRRGRAPASARRACSCRSAAARTRPSRSRSCAARAASSRCSRSATRRRSRARSPSPGCRTCSRAGASTRARARSTAPARSTATCPSPRSSPASALLTAALNGFDAVAMANERSASSGNVVWDGVEVNHQFSKGLRAERLLRAARRRGAAGPAAVLGPAPGLRARDRARVRAHGRATTARSRAATRSSASTRRCAPRRGAVTAPSAASCSSCSLRSARPSICARSSARDLLDDERQFEGFALLTATGGHKPFECVGEEQESLAAIRLLAERPALERAPRGARGSSPRCSPLQPAGAGDPAARARARATSTTCPRRCWRTSVRFSELDGAQRRRLGRRPRDQLVRRASSRARLPVGADRRGGLRRAPGADVPRRRSARPARGSSVAAEAVGGARATATSSCARRASRSTAPSCARCATPASRSRPRPRCGSPSAAARA